MHLSLSDVQMIEPYLTEAWKETLASIMIMEVWSVTLWPVCVPEFTSQEMHEI